MLRADIDLDKALVYINKKIEKTLKSRIPDINELDIPRFSRLEFLSPKFRMKGIMEVDENE